MRLEEALERWGRGWRGPLLAALVALVAGLPGVFTLPTLDRDEARFAEATTQMLETGDFVSIRFQDEPRFKKPVGIYWMQALSVRALSHAEDRAIWAYRIPSLLGAMLAAAACAWGAAAFLRRGLATLAGAALGTTVVLSTEAFIGKTDAMLCGLITLAMAALGRLYLASQGGPPAGRPTKALLWAGLAFGVLVKGPVAPLVAALSLVMLCVWDRKARWLKDLGWGWGLILTAALVGPWAMAITVASDGAFWGAAVAGDLAPKLTGGQESHGAPPGAYLLLSPLLLFPASLLLPAAGVAAWRHRTEPGVRFAIAWIVPTWLMFEIIPTKLPHYVLPTFGAICWLMARALADPIPFRARRAGTIMAGVAALIFAGVGVWATDRVGAPAALPWAIAAGAAFVAAVAAGGHQLILNRPVRALAIGGALGVAAHGLAVGALAPALKPLWLTKQAVALLTAGGVNPREGVTPGPVTAAGYHEPSIVFALGADTELAGPDEAAAAIADGRPAIVDAASHARFRQALKASGVAAAYVGMASGLDYSNGAHDILRVYRPAPRSRP